MEGKSPMICYQFIPLVNGDNISDGAGRSQFTLMEKTPEIMCLFVAKSVRI